MKLFKLISLLFIATIGSLFVSCEETAEVGEYDNWQERNAEFIDSIAEVARVNSDGKWLKILSYKLNPLDGSGTPVEYGVEDYIYCHIEVKGTGTQCPLFTDSVSVNYRGRLMSTQASPQGKVFDESYKGELNVAVNVPKQFVVSGLVAGWSTALMKMVEGDIWRVYIPSELGYGSKEKSDIPAYSALVFDINLLDIISVTKE